MFIPKDGGSAVLTLILLALHSCHLKYLEKCSNNWYKDACGWNKHKCRLCVRTSWTAEKAIGQWLDMGGRRVDASLSYLATSQVWEEQKKKKKNEHRCMCQYIHCDKGGKWPSGGLVSGSVLWATTIPWLKYSPSWTPCKCMDLLLIHWPGSPGNWL